ncbi:hypothetical protein L3Q82_020854 [Scortum barcoo]|uniref:Uncharacterized protein n=1 Tax=Scortum barcoo TaxID=214431 RepID=A0ACB8VAY3_9TELE|nr:hypothetical protein L3Q82_020854 [Scortum barcoo]
MSAPWTTSWTLLRLRLGASREMRNCAVLCLTETWLNDNMPDLSLPARRPASLPCGPQPAVGESPRGADYALREQRLVHKLYSGEQPLLRGDRAHDCKVPATLSAPMSPYQHGEITRWTVFTPTNETHTEPSPTPTWAFSDHISIMLLPAYRPLLRCHTPKQRTITVWPSDAVPALQDCFQRTDWQIFREAAACEGEVDLEDYTSAVLGYISKCTEDVTRTVTEYPNQKPWLNAEVRSLLKA